MNKRIKILLAEDEAIIALSTSKFLKQNGYDVVTVHKGNRAISAVKEDPDIALVLMDINLGKGIDGTEAAYEILKLRPIPIVFLTSYSEKDVVEKVKKITRYGYVLKNSGEFVLLEAISMALELFNVNQKLKQDIEERIKAEKDLKTSESRLNTIFLSSPAGIAVNTADKGLFVDINEAFTNITGYCKNEIIGKEPKELGLWFNDDYSRITEEELQKTGKISNIEVTFRKKNGDVGFALISSEFIEYNDQQCVLTLINDITENKKNLNALNESRKILNNTQKAARLDTWTIDLSSSNKAAKSSGDIKWFSSECGFDFGEILKVTHPDDIEMVKKSWEAAMKGEPYEIEHRVILNNEVFWFYVKAEVEKDKNDHPCKIIGITLDITERKKAEAEILHSISLLKATLESTADGILVVGTDGKVRNYNHRFTELWNMPDSDFVDTDTSVLMSFALNQVSDPEEFLKKILYIYSNPRIESFDKIFLNDGRVFERYSLPQKIGEKIVGRVWSFRDISEKVNFEKALKRSEERTNAIINSVPDLLFTLNKNGIFTDYFVKNEESLYKPTGEFLGKNIKDVLPAELAEKAYEKIQSSVKNKKEESFEYMLDVKNKPKYFENRITPVSDSEVLSIIRDITEENNYKNELIKREKLFTIISQFAEKIFKNGINDENILFILKELGKALDISRAYIFMKIDESDTEIIVKQISEWCADNIFSSAKVLDVGSYRIPKGTVYSGKLEQMINVGYLKAVYSELTDDFEKYLMDVQEIKSFIFIPIFINDKWWGMIGFDECKYERNWDDQEITALKTASNIMGGALQKSAVENELAASNELYHTLIKASPDSVSVTDLDGNLIFSSDKAMELFGYSADEDLNGRSIFSWAADVSKLKAMEHFGNLIKKSITETETYVLKKKDGSEFLAEITASTYRDAENNPKGIILVARDITKKVKAEKMLAEEAIRRKILIEGSSDGIVVLDGFGKLIETNRKFAQMLGYDENELKEMYVWDWDKYLDKDSINNMIETIDENGDHFESKHIRKDGSVYDVEISSNSAFVNGKKLIFCVCRDITQRIAAQKKIKESEERFSKIFHNSPVGISISRITDGIYIDVNEALMKIGGFTKDEVVGHSTIELNIYDGETRDKNIAELKKSGKISNKEINYKKADGTIINVIVSMEIIEINSEKYILGTAIDVTDKKLSEIELIKSLNEKNILLKELQHRVKNNLSVISSLLNLEMENLDNDNSKNIFQNSITRINSLSAIYEQLYSKDNISNIELHEYLTNLLESLENTYKISDNIYFVITVDKDLSIDLKRSVLIGLIFNELLTNSLKYAYPDNRKGAIEAGFGVKNGIARLYVRDHGVGMPNGYNIDTGKSMGLKLVKMLTEQLEGDFRLSSNEGTCTEIEFNV